MTNNTERLNRPTAFLAGILYSLYFIAFLIFWISLIGSATTPSISIGILMVVFGCLLFFCARNLFIGKKTVIAGWVYAVSAVVWGEWLLRIIILCIQSMGFEIHTVLVIIGSVALVGLQLLMALDCFLASSQKLRKVRYLFLLLPAVAVPTCGYVWQKFIWGDLPLRGELDPLWQLFSAIAVYLIFMFMVALFIPMALTAVSFFLSYRDPSRSSTTTLPPV